MRRTRVWILSAVAAFALLSIRDKELVINVPDGQELVAEAYHAPAVMQGLSQAAFPAIHTTPFPSQAKTSEGYRKADNPGALPYNSPFDSANDGQYAPASTPNSPTPYQNTPPAETPAVPSAAAGKEESPVQPIYYGLGGVYYPTTDAPLVTNTTSNTNASTSPAANSPVQRQDPGSSDVFVTGLDPYSGAPGTDVIIQGAGFSANASEDIVRFGAVPAASVSVVSVNQLRATVPSGIAAGFAGVTVSVGASTSKSALFDVLKDSSENVFIDNTNTAIPSSIALTDSSIIRLADIDSNKRLAMLIVDTVAAKTYLLSNNGSGQFTDATSGLPSGVASGASNVTDAAFGDVNNDGSPDILISYSLGQSIRLLINSGAGTFTDETGIRIPSLSDNAASLDIGDVNGDGYPDIVIANRGSEDVLLINNGSGSFTTDVNFALPAVPDGSSDIIFRDINSDGAPDIITANNDIVGASELRNRIYLNGGTGAFSDQTVTVLPSDSEYSEVLDVGDLNKDGNADLVAGCYGQNLLFLNKGGTFEDKTTELMPTNYFHTRDVKLGDINGDGYQDLAILGESALSLLLNDGTGSFKAIDASVKLPNYMNTPAALGGKNIQLADINGDGALDMIIGGQSIRVLSAGTLNLPPLLSAIGNKIVEVGSQLAFNINAFDPNGDILLYSASNLPAGSIFTAQTKLFSWIPGIADLGEYTGVRFVVTEDSANPAQDFEEITINVIPNASNHAPAITSQSPSGPDAAAVTGAPKLFSVSASDSDGDTITYSWTVDGAAAGSNSDSFTYTPAQDGIYAIEVSVNDNKTPPAQANKAAWNVTASTPLNNPPAISSQSPAGTAVTVATGSAQDFSVNAVDPDGDPVTYSWTVNGSAAGANSSSFTYTPTVDGIYAVTVTVDDGKTPAGQRNAAAWNLTSSTRDVPNDIAVHAFRYFWNEADPGTGLVRDRLLARSATPADDTHYNSASVAATGFGLAAFAVAAEKYSAAPGSEWTVTPAELAARAELILDTLLQIQANQAPAGDSSWGKDGFFYHFMNMNDGSNFNSCEVSTIDTAILVAGALTAGEYFKTINPNVLIKARQIYANVNWKAFLDTTPGGEYNRFYKAWSPGTGYNGGHWDYTDESTLLYLLAIGAPTPAYTIDPDCYYSPLREIGNYGVDGKPMIKTWFGSLFAYQFAQAFFDFRTVTGDRGIEWWQNSIDATIANRKFCIDQGATFGYNTYVWGLSSEYGVGANYLGDIGAPPLANPAGPSHSGFVNPLTVTSSIAMLPTEVGETITSMAGDPDLWIENGYGFVDSFKNSTPKIYSDYFVGIDLGAAILMLANNDSSLIWNNFMASQTRYGNMRDLLTQLNFREDATYDGLHVDLDDITAKSQFAYGYIDALRPSAAIKVNLTGVIEPRPYIMAIHTFMNDYAGNYSVSASLSVNGTALGAQTFSHVSGIDDPIVYIEIPYLSLQTGMNTITLDWVSGANWLAFKNVEFSSPVLTDTWYIERSVYASEYRLDDTYYAGHADASKYGAEAYKTFPQALNATTNPCADILFYADDLTRDRKLTLSSIYLDGSAVYVDVLANGQTAAANIDISSPQQVNIPAGLLRSGWNRLTLKMAAGGGAWVVWNTLNFELGGLATVVPPAGLAAASYGANGINLRWLPVTGTNVLYNIYRSQSQGGGYVKINGTAFSSAQYQDSGLQADSAYYYVVTAFESANPSHESNYSSEAAKATGSFEVDYRDGRDPNALSGSSSGQFTYQSGSRHDWTTGPLRKVVLNPGESGWIELGGTDLSQMTHLSMWINGAGADNISIGLESAGSSIAQIAVTASSGWQNLKLKLSEFSGISLTNMTRLYLISNAPAPVTLLVDDISFVKNTAGPVTLDVTARNVSDGSRATGISFDITPGSEFAPANQCLEVKYSGMTAENWKIWVYTKNDNGDAQYLNGQYNGLMRSDGRARIPLVWRVYPVTQAGGVACRTHSDVYTGASMTWNYVKDRNDSDWASANPTGAEYSVACFGRADEWAHLSAVPPGLGDRDPVNSTFYVYLGGAFSTADVGDYASRIFFDVTHE